MAQLLAQQLGVLSPPRFRCCRHLSRETLAAMSYRIGLSVVGTFQSTADAEAAKGVLAAVGMESVIRSDSAYPASSPIELLVRTDDATTARYTLAQANLASG